jgi:N utilization substance protein A
MGGGTFHSRHLGELEAHFNEESGEIELFQFKTVADPIEDENTQMTLVEAQELDPDAQMGDSLGVKVEKSVYGRIAAQTAKQVIIQKLRDAERDFIYEEFKDRVGELITGIVRRFEKGDMVVDLGRTEAAIPKGEQVPSERYRPGERIQGYFLEIHREGRGPQVILSRRTPNLVKALFQMEVPEVREGIVEIKAVAREVGARSKIAVYSRDSDVDPVGACVGMKGSRVQTVVQELRNEKIDIIAWDTDPARFVCNAIAPAEVVKVVIKEKDHSMEVIVPDDQLSLAIGRRGQNVRLAAQLTGWNIDVLSETRVEELAARHKEALTRMLGIDDGTAIVLHSHGFRTMEDITAAGLEGLKRIPGMSENALTEILEKAKAAQAAGQSSETVLAEIMKEQEAAKAAAQAERDALPSGGATSEEIVEEKVEVTESKEDTPKE